MSQGSGKALKSMLFAGLLLLTACINRSNPKTTAIKNSALCRESEAACNVIGGYYGNLIPDEMIGVTISGGGSQGALNQGAGNFATIGGGEGNVAGEGSTVAGGSTNTAIHFYSTIGGGSNNLADGQEATVAGGFKNEASERFATVGGGSGNIASDINATVAGGSGNMANYRFTTVGGGTQNVASSIAAVVSGGDHNLAQGAYSSILGGINNNADGYVATIGGGIGNMASGSYAIVPGGFGNVAGGDYSFAAGRSAQVDKNHSGTFLFADSSAFAFPSLTTNEFAVRATGGVRFVSAVDSSGSPTSGVRLSPGSGAWESLSDYNAKAGFIPVDGYRVLEQLMSVPISTWYYRAQDPSIRHIGPMAQDFYAAFHVGQDNRYISTVDEEGVALAAIQELYRMVQQTHPEYLRQQAQITALEKRLALSNALAMGAILIAGLSFWGRKTGQKSVRSL